VFDEIRAVLTRMELPMGDSLRMSVFRLIRLRVVLVVLFLAAGLQGVAWAQAPATIYLIRHAEKLNDGREDLSPEGFMRAAMLPQLFLPTPGSKRVLLAKPDFLFATAKSKHSNRPYETIMPLSAALNLPISNGIENDDFPRLAQELLSGKYAGKIVLVSWHHGNIPKLTRALGAVPPYETWPEMQFDRIWRIDYVGGKAKVTDLPHGLMVGDSK
jgi:hypothetical protein